MKCPACDFENMPGLERCARCRGSLNLETIDFEPPRASGPVALRHARYRFTNMFGRVVFYFAGLWRILRLPDKLSGAPLGALFWSVIPGMGQVALGQKLIGWSLLGAWCVLMSLSLLGYGSLAGDWCRAGAVLLHATSIAMVMRPGVTRLTWVSRLVLGILLVIALHLTLYRTVTWMTEGFAGVLPVARVIDTVPVRNGDTVLYTGRWSRPERFERGDLVVYRLEYGYGVDRVIGLPGEHVEVASGRVLINGQPLASGIAPLNGSGHFPDYAFDVKPDHYAILPSTLEWHANGENRERLLREMLQRNCHVPESQVSGLAFWRLRPFERFGAME